MIFTNVQKLASQCGDKKTTLDSVEKIITLLNKLQPAMHHIIFGHLGNLGTEALNAAHTNIMADDNPVYDMGLFQRAAQTLYDNRNGFINTKSAFYKPQPAQYEDDSYELEYNDGDKYRPYSPSPRRSSADGMHSTWDDPNYEGYQKWEDDVVVPSAMCRNTTCLPEGLPGLGLQAFPDSHAIRQDAHQRLNRHATGRYVRHLQQEALPPFPCCVPRLQLR